MPPAPPPPDFVDDALAAEDARVREIVARGPTGAFVLAGVSTAIVVAIYALFYLLAWLPRGVVQ